MVVEVVAMIVCAKVVVEAMDVVAVVVVVEAMVVVNSGGGGCIGALAELIPRQIRVEPGARSVVKGTSRSTRARPPTACTGTGCPRSACSHLQRTMGR